MKRIAYITDIHLDEAFPVEHGVDARKNWKQLLADVSNRNIDEVIFGGDIGEREANQWFFASLKDFRLTITLGNHDHFAEVIKHYTPDSLKRSNELYYAHQDTYFKYIFLDSSAEAISDTQFTWLKHELITDKKVIVFIHHPILGIDTAVDKAFPLRGREKIKYALQEVNNEVTIFCGHYHMVDERIAGNIKQFITPAASYQIKKKPDKLEADNRTFGYRIISISQDKIDTEALLYQDGLFASAVEK